MIESGRISLYDYVIHFYVKKREDFLLFFHYNFMKSRTYIKNLRHGSLQMNVLCRHLKFHAWKIIMISKGDILVQNIKVKKSIFRFLDPSFHCLFTNVYIINMS